MNRREFVVGAAGAATAGLAGCQTGRGDSATITCSTAVREFGDGDISQASVRTRRPDSGAPLAELAIDLDNEAVPAAPQDRRLGRIEVTDSRDELVAEIPIEEPTSVRRSYAVAIGPQPQHGQYTLALDVGGERVDALAIDFNCHVERPGSSAEV